MQEQNVLELVNREVAQLQIYRRLLRTTMESIGEHAASEPFTIVLETGKVLRCSPAQFVELEEILTSAVLGTMVESIESDDAVLEAAILRLLRS